MLGDPGREFISLFRPVKETSSDTGEKILDELNNLQAFSRFVHVIRCNTACRFLSCHSGDMVRI